MWVTTEGTGALSKELKHATGPASWRDWGGDMMGARRTVGPTATLHRERELAYEQQMGTCSGGDWALPGVHITAFQILCKLPCGQS